MSEKREGYQFVGWYIDKECTKRLNPGKVPPGMSSHCYKKYAAFLPQNGLKPHISV